MSTKSYESHDLICDLAEAEYCAQEVAELEASAAAPQTPAESVTGATLQAVKDSDLLLVEEPTPWPLPPAPAASPEQATSEPIEYVPLAKTREILDEIARAIEMIDGKPHKRPKRLVDRDMWQTTVTALVARGEFFRSADKGYYHDRAANVIMTVTKDDPTLWLHFRALGYQDGTGLGPAICRNLVHYAGLAPIREVHRMAAMVGDAVYINIGNRKMLKLDPDSMSEVPIGTDGVYLIADDIAPWPSPQELTSYMDAMRDRIGRACTEVLPGSPLHTYFPLRYSDESPVGSDGAAQMLMSRLLFTFVANHYVLWPLLFHSGDQNSAKSTLFELWLSMLKNGKEDALFSFPSAMDGFVAAISNSSVAIFDNVDRVDFEARENKTYADKICNLAYGALETRRKLYSDGTPVKLTLKTHCFLTARVYPFNHAPDAMRRIIHLTMAPALDPTQRKTKDVLRKAVLDNRVAILAEIVLRVQNILRAHIETRGRTYEPQSEMHEFETFTARCADYEGRLDEDRQIWSRYASQYRNDLSDNNSFLYAVSIWIGQPGNIAREVSSTTLFGEMAAIFAESPSYFPYRTPSALGIHIRRNLPGLRTYGFSQRSLDGYNVFRFDASLEKVKECTNKYHDYEAASVKKSIRKLSRYEQPMEIDD